MKCLVYVPDQRSQGEWGEMYLTEAARRTGYNPWAMRMWDHTRSLDYLCSRPDVDASRIGCFGASGGGSATMYTAGIDTRIPRRSSAACRLTWPRSPINSSTIPNRSASTKTAGSR